MRNFDRALSMAGYEVRVATDGAVALEVLDAWRPDVILLDLVMPILDGWGFLQGRLANALFMDIPVVVLSGLPDDCCAVGNLVVDAVMPKPFDLLEMLTVVRRLAEPAAA